MPRVLFADGDSLLSRVLRRYLEALEYRVQVAPAGGARALTSQGEDARGVDAVFLALGTACLEDATVLEELGRFEPGVRVVVTSWSKEPLLQQRLDQAGAFA